LNLYLFYGITMDLKNWETSNASTPEKLDEETPNLKDWIKKTMVEVFGDWLTDEDFGNPNYFLQKQKRQGWGNPDREPRDLL
jgi:hypothetical protein